MPVYAAINHPPSMGRVGKLLGCRKSNPGTKLLHQILSPHCLSEGYSRMCETWSFQKSSNSHHEANILKPIVTHHRPSGIPMSLWTQHLQFKSAIYKVNAYCILRVHKNCSITNKTFFILPYASEHHNSYQILCFIKLLLYSKDLQGIFDQSLMI